MDIHSPTTTHTPTHLRKSIYRPPFLPEEPPPRLPPSLTAEDCFCAAEAGPQVPEVLPLHRLPPQHCSLDLHDSPTAKHWDVESGGRFAASIGDIEGGRVGGSVVCVVGAVDSSNVGGRVICTIDGSNIGVLCVTDGSNVDVGGGVISSSDSVLPRSKSAQFAGGFWASLQILRWIQSW